MNVNIVDPPWPTRRERVIALHCSGAGAGQWRYLAEALGGRYEVIAPEHYGSESTGPWTGEHTFTIADEAARAIALIDQSEDKVHLVGHSYGGGVALDVALARPDRIASMALYEPSAFHLCRGVVTGDYRGAVAAFVDYWNGPGAWDSMRPAAQNALIRWAPKGPLDFQALIDNPTPADAYRSLAAPVLILRGEHAPVPTRIIADALSDLLPASRIIAIGGAGHMGPFTHAPEVSALIVRHIVDAEADAQRRRRRRPRSLAEVLGAAAPPAEAVS
jgi:pimeloyl-ACP methyl ester carboxylesterase